LENFFTYSALFFYLANYLVGWLLFTKVISMKKITHQVLFAAIIINLTLILFVYNFSGHLLFSVLCMLVLPFGKKGGMYHRIVSSVGLLAYVIYFLHK